MAKPKTGWGELVGRVGVSALELLAAELRGLRADFLRSLVAVRGIGIAAFLALSLVFWGLGVALVAAVAGLSLLWPLWAAALAVAALLLLLSLIVGLVTRTKMRKLDLPTAAVKRRVDDHVDWWRQELMGETARTVDATGDEEGAPHRESS